MSDRDPLGDVGYLTDYVMQSSGHTPTGVNYDTSLFCDWPNSFRTQLNNQLERQAAPCVWLEERSRKQEKKIKRQAVLSLADGRNSFGVDWLIHKGGGLRGMSEFRSAEMLADVIGDLIHFCDLRKN